MRTLQAALARGTRAARRIVATGTYAGFDVVVGVSIFGGYSPDFTDRDLDLPCGPRIARRARAPALLRAVRTATRIGGFTVHGTDATARARAARRCSRTAATRRCLSQKSSCCETRRGWLARRSSSDNLGGSGWCRSISSTARTAERTSRYDARQRLHGGAWRDGGARSARAETCAAGWAAGPPAEIRAAETVAAAGMADALTTSALSATSRPCCATPSRTRALPGRGTGGALQAATYNADEPRHL